MKILQWTTQAAADSFLAARNTDASFAVGGVTTTLDEVKPHTTDVNIFWMYRDVLESNGGTGTSTITTAINDGITATDFIELDKTDTQQLITDGYLAEDPE